MLLCQKEHFSLEPHIHYLNGAYMSPLMKQVETAGVQAVVRKSRPYDIAPVDFFTDAERLRGLFGQLVGGHAEQVALVPSVSYGMAPLARNLRVRPGQKIVVAEAQFPSNVYPWMELVRQGAELVFVPMPEEPAQRGQRWNERILDAIDAQTALVAIGHVHWATGTLFDLAAIARRVHECGGRIVVDGTQSVGALPIDVQAFQLDALICAGYKWLMGPYSLGYAWYSEDFLSFQPVEENWISRADSENFAGLTDYKDQYQSGARRFDVGERSNFILVPMGIAALEQLLAWGIGNIQQYCRHLTAGAVETWRNLGYWVDDDAYRSGHLFGLQLPAGMDPLALQQQLKAHHIYVSVRGGFVRVSPNVYNDAADVEALTQALAQCR